MSKGKEKRERVFAALVGEPADRVPVAAWGHRIPAETNTERLARESLEAFYDYDWDWLKLNPRATYFAEAWGWDFDFTDYRGVLPRLKGRGLEPFDPSALQLAKVSHPVWKDHLRLVELVKRGLDGAPFVQTIFSPLSVLAFLAGNPTDHSPAAVTKNRLDAVLELIRNRPEKALAGLDIITESLARLAAASVEAGADGVFFAITGLAREGALTREEFLKFGRPFDLRVLDAVKGAGFNILHNCGARIYWEDTLTYPVEAVNWAAVGQENPDIETAKGSAKPALIGGVDEKGTLLKGSPYEVNREARRALALAGKDKFLLAPGCAVDPATPRANLKALRAAVGD